MSFDEVKTAYHDSADPAVQAAALAQGIATARANAARLFRSAGQAPISTLKARYEAETGEKVSANPLIGVTQDDVEHAYRAWAENPAAAEAPWVLLAVWVKEGIGAPTPEKREPAGIPATSAADARSIYRSLAYYWNFGTDVFIAHTAATGADNAADFSAGTGAAHDTAFQAQIARQVSSGRLIRDVSGEIDAALSVAPAASPGLFTVTASPRFPELSLMLVDAFYREQRDELVRDPRVGANPDPGLTYMRWNMRASTFDDFLNRAPNPDPDGTTPTRETWAFHRPITPAEYGQPRENAMRFKYLIEVFQHAYQDKS